MRQLGLARRSRVRQGSADVYHKPPGTAEQWNLLPGNGPPPNVELHGSCGMNARAVVAPPPCRANRISCGGAWFSVGLVALGWKRMPVLIIPVSSFPRSLGRGGGSGGSFLPAHSLHSLGSGGGLRPSRGQADCSDGRGRIFLRIGTPSMIVGSECEWAARQGHCGRAVTWGCFPVRTKSVTRHLCAAVSGEAAIVPLGLQSNVSAWCRGRPVWEFDPIPGPGASLRLWLTRGSATGLVADDRGGWQGGGCLGASRLIAAHSQHPGEPEGLVLSLAHSSVGRTSPLELLGSQGQRSRFFELLNGVLRSAWTRPGRHQLCERRRWVDRQRRPPSFATTMGRGRWDPPNLPFRVLRPAGESRRPRCPN